MKFKIGNTKINLNKVKLKDLAIITNIRIWCISDVFATARMVALIMECSVAKILIPLLKKEGELSVGVSVNIKAPTFKEDTLLFQLQLLLNGRKLLSFTVVDSGGKVEMELTQELLFKMKD